MRNFGLTGLLALALLSGCASTFDRAWQAHQAGKTDQARQLYVQSIGEGSAIGESWNNLGVLYDGIGDREAAVRAFTMSARYGVPMAQQNLVQRGAPVPAADLVATRQASADSGGLAGLMILNSALQGYNQGKAAGAAENSQAKEFDCTANGYMSGTTIKCRERR